MADPFPQTRWSLVLEAQENPEAPASQRALDELCRAYWFPIYGYARRRGLSAHDAEDSTQSFFARLLARGSFNDVSKNRGRLRAFLLTAMKNFLNSEWTKSQAQKRGGGQRLLSIDLDSAEQRLDREPTSADASPDQVYELTWARAILAEVYAKLRRSYVESDQENQFMALRNFLTWDGEDRPYSEFASQLEINEGSVRTAVHRMRARFREMLESEIRDTVTTPEDAADELTYLKRVLAQN